jgi:hypothetical protein
MAAGQNRMGTGGRKRERLPKAKTAVAAALAAHDRIQAVSDRIRRGEGLAPVPENAIVREWRKKVNGSAPAQRKAELSPADQVAELAERRAKLERDREQLESDLQELVRSAQADSELSVSSIARKLKLSRQRLYQLAA